MTDAAKDAAVRVRETQFTLTVTVILSAVISSVTGATLVVSAVIDSAVALSDQ